MILTIINLILIHTAFLIPYLYFLSHPILILPSSSHSSHSLSHSSHSILPRPYPSFFISLFILPSALILILPSFLIPTFLPHPIFILPLSSHPYPPTPISTLIFPYLISSLSSLIIPIHILRSNCAHKLLPSLFFFKLE